MHDVFNLPISLGAVADSQQQGCEALAKPCRGTVPGAPALAACTDH
jgi:hypothetical protein